MGFFIYVVIAFFGSMHAFKRANNKTFYTAEVWPLWLALTFSLLIGTVIFPGYWLVVAFDKLNDWWTK